MSKTKLQENRRRKVPELFLSHLKDHKQREEYATMLLQSLALQHVYKIIDQKLKELERAEADFNNPAWAYMEAHYIGKREALKDIQRLINFAGDID